MIPTTKGFYEHIHSIQSLLRYLEDTKANIDPVDQTLNMTFEFKVFSKRWGNFDTYKITRIPEGWDVSHLAINGACDKSGSPYLFNNLAHDSISYPNILGFAMECLWDNAEQSGLTPEDVQQGLSELAEWVSKVEKSTPSGSIWKGYF